MRQAVHGFLLPFVLVLAASQHAAATQVCKPRLSVHQLHFSEVRPQTQERSWTATVSVDASQCKTTAGYFDLGVLRQKENGVELEFREQFIWARPSTLIGIEFWADEAVEDFWIDSVQACPCSR
jgi:hypothetical protein